MTSSTSSPAPTTLLPGNVELLLRLWTEPAAATPLTWTGDTPLLRMVRQAVALGGGTPDPTSSGLLRAYFPEEFQAAATARRLQALVTGFASVAGQPTVAASIGIFCPGSPLDDASPASQSHALQAYLQQRAQPAQILFSCPRHRSSTLTSTLRAQRLDTLASPGSEDLEFQELLWAYKDQAAAAAVQARIRAAKQRQTATLPLQPPPTAPAGGPAPTLSQRALSFLTAIKDQGADIFARLVLLFRQRPSSLSWPSRIPLAVLLRSRPAQLAASGVCVAALAFFLLVHHRSSAPAPTTAPIQAPAATKPAPPPVVTEKPPANTATPTDKPRKPEPPKQTHTEEDKPARGRGDLSPEQTRQVLNRGQAELDRGCYTKAIGYYRRVLEDDPRNASASSGIDKARTRMRLSGDDPQGHCR